MLRVNRANSTVFSFGASWRSEEQIIFFIRSTFRERDAAASGYIAYLGTENVKS